MNTGDITIDQTDLQSVQTIWGSIEDKELKNRAVANALAVKTAAKFFDAEEYQIDDETGLYAFGDLFADADIADLYINNCYVDVRLYFSKDELGVPKYHFEHDITPAVYMFVKVTEDLSSATVSGFVRPENIDLTKEAIQGFYPVSEESLDSFYGIEQRLQMKFDDDALSDAILYDFADGKYDNFYGILSALICSKSSRYRLHRILKAKSVYNMVSVTMPSANEENALDTTETDVDDTASQLPEKPENEQDLNDDLEGLYDALDSNDNDAMNDSDETVNPDEDLAEALEYKTETTPNYNETEKETPSENSEQIDSLFNSDEPAVVPVSSNKNGFIGLIMLIIIVAAIGSGIMWIFNHTKGSLPFKNEIVSQSEPAMNDNDVTEPVDYTEQQPAQQDVAMPDETVENKPETTSKEMGNSVAIPAIEKNLDASVLVSNLRVDWEVPEGYVSNTAAKRYLVKLGKVIQLNLKTDLLLLSKPPISNRIAVEITYDQPSGRFVFVNLLSSSGEKTVDDAIIDTIKVALSTSLSTNTESFAKLKGNPVLIIHL